MAEPAAATVPWTRGGPYGLDGLFYPSEEERESPHSGGSFRLMFYLYHALRTLLYGRHELAYVAANQFIYYEPHDPRANVAPDVWVCYGVPKEPERYSFRTWEEGATPSFVVEISSRNSRPEDRGRKLPLYQDVLRCQEYLIYDEERHEFLFYRRENQRFRLVPPGPDGRVYSQELEAWFGLEPGLLMRVYDPDGEPVRWAEELHELAAFERRHAQEEARRAEAALHELDVQRQRAEEERQRAEEERQRAETERQRAQEERRRAEAEHQQAQEERRRAALLEAELQRLRSELERLRQDSSS